jgi:hypothetical protein
MTFEYGLRFTSVYLKRDSIAFVIASKEGLIRLFASSSNVVTVTATHSEMFLRRSRLSAKEEGIVGTRSM